MMGFPNPRIFYGNLVGIDGNPMEILWTSDGNPMEIIWKSYENPMETQWKLWEFYGNRWNSSIEFMA